MQSYPELLTIALFGMRAQFKNALGNMILNCQNAFTTISHKLVVGETNSFKVFNTSDYFNEENMHPDQDIIDFMACSHPGINLFILAIDTENAQEEKVVAQISKLQEALGEEVTEHLVVILPDIESFHSLAHLKELFNIRLAIANENLAKECRAWCANHQSFLYDYKNYSQDVVIRRKAALEKRRCNPPSDHGRAGAAPNGPSTSQHAYTAGGFFAHHNGNGNYGALNDIFNIVLLGLTGTGKSASANTILAAGNSQLDPSQLFKSEPSSMPVTTQCEIRIMERLYGMSVRVVDTPDFLNDQLENTPAQIEECKKYCQPGKCVVLLVLQLGRFTDVERGILENLEVKLGWRIRESTIVVLTHGEDLRGSLDQFLKGHTPLKNIVDMCGSRCHLLNNHSRDTKQVIELIKKIPNYKIIFPKFSKKTLSPDCLIC
uniref:AIG1-type G domain-containing protein n=1 Tax=Lates calcarifer TaxID=8187 RepID=A0A4W6C2Q3_LATCA